MGSGVMMWDLAIYLLTLGKHHLETLCSAKCRLHMTVPHSQPQP